MKNISKQQTIVSNNKFPQPYKTGKAEKELNKQQPQEKKDQQNVVLQIKKKKSQKNSIIKTIKAYFYTPLLILVFYFTIEMILLSSLKVGNQMYETFRQFFQNLKTILQQNTIFLLFWSIIIIKTKIPHLHRLFYHTIVISIFCENQEVQCSICLGDKCDYIMPKCQHAYHAQCIEKWIKTQGCCPYCRVKVENKLVRKIPWKRFFKSIFDNKIKWACMLIVCFAVQYRICYSFFKKSIS